MVAGVITLGRQHYAVGLYWENSPGSGRITQIAKEAANQPGQQADFYAIRQGNRNGRIPQFGLCSGDAGQKAGMPSLAGCIANLVPGSWAGAFRLPDGFVVIIVRDDLIVPDGDLLFMEESEARDRLIQEVGFGGLQTIYAPESWSIPSADSLPLSLIINDNKDVRLQQVRIPKKLKIAAAAIGGLLVLGFGIAWYWQMQIDADNARRAEQEEALRRAQRAAMKSLPGAFQTDMAPPEPKYDRKWESAPKTMDIIAACQKGLASIPFAIVGWKFNGLKCDGRVITVNWTHDKGVAAPPPGQSINDTASISNQTIALPPLAGRGAENLLDSIDLTNRYLLQNWPGSIAKATDDPLPPPPAGYTGPWNPPPPPWVKRSFTLNVAVLPAGLPVLIGDLPGAVINNMTYGGGAGSTAWSVEGVIYENRK